MSHMSRPWCEGLIVISELFILSLPKSPSFESHAPRLYLLQYLFCSCFWFWYLHKWSSQHFGQSVPWSPLLQQSCTYLPLISLELLYNSPLAIITRPPPYFQFQALYPSESHTRARIACDLLDSNPSKKKKKNHKHFFLTGHIALIYLFMSMSFFFF